MFLRSVKFLYRPKKILKTMKYKNTTLAEKLVYFISENTIKIIKSDF